MDSDIMIGVRNSTYIAIYARRLHYGIRVQLRNQTVKQANVPVLPLTTPRYQFSQLSTVH